MSQKSKEKITTLHNVYILLTHIPKALACLVDAEEIVRLTTCLESEREETFGFYQFSLTEGLQCFVNLKRVIRISVSNDLTHIPVKKWPEKTDAELEKYSEERDNSDDPATVRLWITDYQKTEVIYDMSYHESEMIRLALQNHQQFITFTDDDGDQVFLPTVQIAAVEVFDNHYLSDEEIARALGDDE